MLLPRKAELHLIDHGRVLCPNRGDIDVEQCLGCTSLKAVQVDGAQPAVTCKSPRHHAWIKPEESSFLFP